MILWYTDTGEIGGIFIATDFVTSPIRMEQALRKSEKQFRTLANAMSNLAWMAAPLGLVFWYKPHWYDYAGTTPKSMEGWGWQSVHDPASRRCRPVPTFPHPRGAGERLPGKSGSLVWNEY